MACQLQGFIMIHFLSWIQLLTTSCSRQVTEEWHKSQSGTCSITFLSVWSRKLQKHRIKMDQTFLRLLGLSNHFPSSATWSVSWRSTFKPGSAWSKELEIYLNLSACATALASLVCLIVTHSSGSQMLSGSAALAALARLILSNVSSKNKHRLSEDHANFS